MKNLTTFTSSTDHLQAQPDEISYFKNFPRDLYKLYHVDTLGSFFLDEKPDCIKDFLKKNLAWEPNIQKLIRKHVKPGSSVIDAGAHIGTHTLTLSKAVEKDGCVYAFEPQMKLYAELIMNLQQNKCDNVIAFRAALGESSKEVQMQVAGYQNEGATEVGSGGDGVYMTTIDELNLSNISLIKIDVEYSENEVLKGAVKTIEKNRPAILLEVLKNHSSDSSEQSSERVSRTLSLFQKMSYTLMHITENDYLALPIEHHLTFL
jgi:FkbM family methyltransferase